MTRPNPVSALLTKQAWRLRLWISGFRDLEDPSNPDGPLDVRWRERPDRNVWLNTDETTGTPDVREEARAEYYRQLGVESHRKPPVPGNRRKRIAFGPRRVFPFYSAAKDKKILRLLADGVSIRAVKKQLHVGQGRVYRLLAKVKERIRRETRNGKRETTG